MNHTNDGFEDYRRQRERLRRKGVGDRRPLSGPSNALRELEAVEAREERDRQLSREMQDFFETATRTAAEIVQKVAESAKLRIDEQLGSEMQEFLLESIARVQDLVSAVLKENSGSTAEEVIEPLMHNLVGKLLDNFRSAGTAHADKHLGVDPLQTNLDDVRREFAAKMPQPRPTDDALTTQTPRVGGKDEPPAGGAGEHATIDDHLVAELQTASADKASGEKQDLERFQHALDALVRQGSMSKDEAKAALKARKSGRR